MCKQKNANVTSVKDCGAEAQSVSFGQIMHLRLRMVSYAHKAFSCGEVPMSPWSKKGRGEHLRQRIYFKITSVSFSRLVWQRI